MGPAQDVKEKNLTTRYIIVEPLIKKEAVNILKATREERLAFFRGES